ncbi:MAG TPA: DUF3147 family protein [Candidatus Gastranaerophilales bacterium]|nr:DUF3147 family protein [Candidatus Gastranaerophilales bacterium]
MGAFFIIKILISAVIIAVVTEIAKKYTSIGGLIAAMPITTLLSIFWLYFEKKDTLLIANFLYSVIQGVFITFLFFIPCIILLKKGYNFYLSVFISLMLLSVGVYIYQKLAMNNF